MLMFLPVVTCRSWHCSLSPLFREAVGSYAENQRITAVRRVYQRGCVNPMINIEQLWRDYNKYEEVTNNRILCDIQKEMIIM